MTELLTAETIDQAANCLQNGELIAFPTETVFGLGAVAENEAAVAKVFQVKGRPSDNPLIVHIGQAEDIFNYAIPNKEGDALIKKLSDAFWPGPLTMVVPIAEGTFPKNVTGGLNSVGIRFPDNEDTQALIRAVGKPLVGPSANLSGKPSPTTVDHVYHDFSGKIAGILASQPSRIGVESTVLDLTNPNQVQILRPGYITEEMLRTAIPDLNVSTVSLTDLESADRPKSPGMKYRHYSPRQEVIAVAPNQITDYVLAHKENKRLGVMAPKSYLQAMGSGIISYVIKDSVEDAMHNLYAGLRYFDDQEAIDEIVVIIYPDIEDNKAYRNRLTKAASQVVE